MEDIHNFIKANIKQIDRNTHIRVVITDIANNLNIGESVFDQKIKLFDQKGYDKSNNNYIDYYSMNKTLKISNNIEKCYTITPISIMQKNIGFKKVIVICEKYNYIGSEDFPCKSNYESIKNVHETIYNIDNLYNLVFLKYDDNNMVQLDINKQNIFEDMFYNNISNTIASILE
jgi:hypothetical protein